MTDPTSSQNLPTTGRSAIWVDNNVIGIKDVPVAAPGPGEILLRIRAAGICGSDLHAFHSDAPRKHIPGIGPGHELAGEVAALGEGVKGPPVGTHVAAMAVRSCRTCEFCRVGRLQLCTQLRIAGSSYPGGMSEYFLAQEDFVYLVPDGMDWPVAALSEPCAISLHGMKRAQMARGQRVLVLGAGTIGLFAALVAHDAGAGYLGVTARYPQQADAARALGADVVYDPGDVGPGSEAAAKDWDLVVETVGGSAPTLQQGIDLANRGGKVLLLGIHQGPQSITTTGIWLKELDIVGAWGYDDGSPHADYDDTLALLNKYRDLVAPLVTHTFPLDQAGDAFAASVDKTSGAIKVTVLP